MSISATYQDLMGVNVKEYVSIVIPSQVIFTKILSAQSAKTIPFSFAFVVSGEPPFDLIFVGHYDGFFLFIIKK